MALITCPDCSNQVSDRAPACPKCGAPIAAHAEAVATGKSVTTIQQTSKSLKRNRLLALTALWVGIVWLIFGVVAFGETDGAGSGVTSILIPSLLILIGGTWNIATRLRIWWHHK